MQQFDNIKKSVDQIYEQASAEEEGGDSRKEHSVKPMAQRVRTRNLSDSSATYDSERTATKDGGSHSQEYHGSQRDSSGGQHALQRRETLAAFHQHRERGAAEGVASGQVSRPRWRRREHIYENLDEILEDLKQSSPALDAALRQQPRTRRTKPQRRETVQEKGESQSKLGLLRPCYHSADKLPSHNFPALSRNPSPGTFAATQKPPASLQGSSPSADAFSSLQSADSGYMSSERAMTNATSQPPSDKLTSAPLRHFPSAMLPPFTDFRGFDVPMTGVSSRDSPTRARHEAHYQQQQHAFTHKRQESSPACFQRDTMNLTAGPNPTGILSQPVRSDRALRRKHSNDTPKSILKKAESAKASASSSKKSGHQSSAKQQKSKTGGAISFLATLNKVSGTESVSDFDFQPSNPPAFVQQVSPQLVMQSAPDIGRTPFHSLSQPSSESHGTSCESYIGLIGSAYQNQLGRPKGPSGHHMQDQHYQSNVADDRRKESKMVRKGRDTRSRSGEEKHRQKFSLSQPATQDDLDDDTLVLHKGNSPSYDDEDTLVMYNRRHAKKRGTSVKDSQPVPTKGNTAKEPHAASRRDSGSRDLHGISRRESGSRDHHPHGVSRKDSGLRDPHAASRRDSGSRDPHAVSRRDSGSRDPHAVSRRDSGSRDPHAVSRRDSASRDSSAGQMSQQYSRQDHHYGPAHRSPVYSRSEGKQQPKPVAARPTRPVMEETWC